MGVGTVTLMLLGGEMHPKFVERLANIYVTKLTEVNEEAAKEWAERCLNRENVLVVAEKVRELLRKKGYKPK